MRLISIAFLLAVTVAASGAEPNVTVTILTTNAADLIGQGEWSFAAWVEVDEKTYLFDTGWSPRNVLTNAEALGISSPIGATSSSFPPSRNLVSPAMRKSKRTPALPELSPKASELFFQVTSGK